MVYRGVCLKRGCHKSLKLQVYSWCTRRAGLHGVLASCRLAVSDVHCTFCMIRFAVTLLELGSPLLAAQAENLGCKPTGLLHMHMQHII